MARAIDLRPSEFLEFLTPDELSGIEKNDPTWLECGGERYMMAVRRDEKKGCLFLDEDKHCMIYEARPNLCRLYPFQVVESSEGKFKGFQLHSTGVECPRHHDGVVQVKPLHNLWVEECRHQKDYDRLVREFNRKRISGKRPVDFLSLFFTPRGSTPRPEVR